MTKTEQKQEEIRLLNAKINDAKQHNDAYAKETEELAKAKSLAVAEVEGLKKEIAALVEAKNKALEEVVNQGEVIAKNKTSLSTLTQKAQEADKKRKSAESKELKAEKRREELTAKAQEAETRLRLFNEDYDAKSKSLKSWEEQLLVKEALLNKREETLDLEKKGVKVKK